MEHINCGWCGTTFVKKNSLHKFCTTACKKKSWRKQNQKPEFPSFITRPNPQKVNIPKTTYAPSPPSYPVDELIKEIKPPVRKVKRIVNSLPSTTAKIDETPEDRLKRIRDIKEQKIMNEVMDAFDKMLVEKRKYETKSGFHSHKQIDKKITKLELKRKKVIRQVDRLNKAIRKYVKKISKDINKGNMTNERAQFKIDSLRKKEVNNLVEIVKNRDWILLWDEDYYFPY